MLVVFGGLPGTGKTTLSRALAQRRGALHLRIDTIEQAIRDAGIAPVGAAGYAAAQALAESNLALGHIVIADCVNPVRESRAAWREVAARAGVPLLEVELVCTDRDTHRQRVEARRPDIPGHMLPGWPEIVTRDYRPWTDPHLVIDTATTGIEDAVARIAHQMEKARSAARP